MYKSIILILISILTLGFIGCTQPTEVDLDAKIQIKTIDATVTREGASTSERATEAIQRKVADGKTLEYVMQKVKDEYESPMSIFTGESVILGYEDNKIIIDPSLNTTRRIIEAVLLVVDIMHLGLSDVTYTYSDGHLDIFCNATEEIFIHPFN